MTAIARLVRPRTLLSLIVALVVCWVLPSSCSSGQRFELTLRVHDGDQAAPGNCQPPAEPDSRIIATCQYHRDEQTWTDGAGLQAVVPAYTRSIDIVNAGSSKGSCAGRSMGPNGWEEFETARVSQARSIRLEIDDGSVLALDPDHGIWVNEANDGCFEMSGSWRGIAGDLANRTGTFTMINDSSVQTVLHLVED